MTTLLCGLTAYRVLTIADGEKLFPMARLRFVAAPRTVCSPGVRAAPNLDRGYYSALDRPFCTYPVQVFMEVFMPDWNLRDSIRQKTPLWLWSH